MEGHLLGLSLLLVCGRVLSAGLCGQPLVTGPNAIPDDHITASSSIPPSDPNTVTGPQRGRLFLKASILNNGTKVTGGWAPSSDKKDEFIQANFDDLTYIEKVATQGRFLGNGHVTSYKMAYSEDGVSWKPVLDSNGSVKTFSGNVDANTPVVNDLGCPVFAKAIRIVPVTWDNHIAMRFDLIGCSLDNSGQSFTTPKPAQTTPATTPTTSLTTPTTPSTKPTTPSTTPTTPSTTPTTPLTTPIVTGPPPFMPGILSPFGTASTLARPMGVSSLAPMTFTGGRTACLSQPTDCRGKPDGNYQYCTLCNDFITCTNGYFVAKKCSAPNLRWDDVAKQCILQSSTCP